MVGGNSYNRIGVKTSSYTAGRPRREQPSQLISLVSHFDYLEKFGKIRKELLMTEPDEPETSSPIKSATKQDDVVEPLRPSKLRMVGVLSVEDSISDVDQTPC